MNPRDFQVLASSLAAGGTPAASRAAISRAYYAAFNVGAELLRGMRFSLGRGAAAHGEVQRCLANSGDVEVAAAASELHSLHSQRIRADYQMDRTDVENRRIAVDVARQAGSIIRILDDAFGGPDRAGLETAIRAWRKANGYP
jgi:uncharacterized protein (UPF0332 family)